jgi:uncharacterized repeat protein (TIGR02543 family)
MYYTNQVVTLAAQASVGYVFVNWSGNTGGITDVSQATVSVLMDSNRAILANFAASTARYTVTVAAEPPGSGSIVLSPNEGNYAVNQVVPVAASSNEGYIFSHWAGDLTGTTSAASLRMDKDKSVTAVFNSILTIQQAGVDRGKVEAIPYSTSGVYAAGAVVRLTARPSLGYLFDGWTGDITDIPDVGKATVTVVMDTGRTLTANFVSSPPLKVTPAVEYEGSGSITLEPVQPPEGYPASQEIRVYALPKVGYAFSQWTGDATGTSPILTLPVDGEKRIVAVFDPKVAVQADPVEGGSVEVTSPRSSGGYATGTEITVEVVAGKGYKFKSWSGDLSGSDNPAGISMDSPKTLTALFVKESGFPWWWIIVGIVMLCSGLIALRLAYVVVRRRSEAA